jgi:O-antigen ligase
VPFFGNHPGGRYVELVNLPVAGSALGLTFQAWRQRRPLPSGWTWLAALAVVASAALALVPTLPAALVRAAQVNAPSLTLVQALVAAEGDPLYSPGAFLQLVLCVLWALALRWAGADVAFARRAMRAVFAGLVVVIALGALRFHGLIDLRRHWFSVVDPNLMIDDPMQSVFWNPGWLAGYFSLAFGLSLALLWLERPPGRWVVATLLAAAWAYFLLSRQRVGIAAAVAIVLLFVWLSSASLGRRRRRFALGATAALLLTAFAASAAFMTETWRPGASRLLAEPALDEFRRRLWSAALLMWRAAPLFGIGEGAFCWRFRDFVPAGSALDLPFSGDAHNTWLQTLATRGLLGLGALGGLALALVTALRRLLAGSVPAVPRGVGIGLAGALLGALVYSGPQGLFYIQGIQILFWGTVALASLGEGDEPIGRAWRSRRSRVAAALGLGLLLAARAVTAWPAWTGLEDRLAGQPRGFYPPRQFGDEPVRWSSRHGVLCLYSTTPSVRLRVNPGQRPASLMPLEVRFRVGKRLVDRVLLDRPEWTERAFVVPEAEGVRPPPVPLPFGDCAAGAPVLRLEVEVSNVWSRLISKGLPDYRHLGVAIAPGQERH